MIYFNASLGFRQRFSFTKISLKARKWFFYNLHKTPLFLLGILPNIGAHRPVFPVFSIFSAPFRP